MQVRDAYIVAYGRSPYCKAWKGSFAHVHPVDFGGLTLKGVLARVPQLDPMEIDDLVVGCSHPTGVQDYNMGRLIAQRAGLPDKVTAQTVNRFCSSGLQAIATAANAICSGQMDCVVAGGCESMSLVPMEIAGNWQNPWLLENAPDNYISMGLTAENVAEEYHVSREDMEKMCCESHAKAAAAQAAGYFDEQIIPIEVTDLNGAHILAEKDEGIRANTTMEVLAGLKPCFKKDGVITAAVSSQCTDGAGFLVLMCKEKMEALGLKPIAKFRGFAVDGVPTRIMGIGPIKAVPRVLKMTGLALDEMGTIELNEAFASQALVCIRELGMDPAKVNPEGGAMAHGHPFGGSGAMLTIKALSHMRRCGGQYCMVTMCIGGGQGAAAIFEMC